MKALSVTVAIILLAALAQCSATSIAGCNVEGYDFSRFNIPASNNTMQPHLLYTTYQSTPWTIALNVCGNMHFPSNTSYYHPCDGQMACAFPTFGGVASAINVANWPGADLAFAPPTTFAMKFTNGNTTHCTPTFSLDFVCGTQDADFSGATFAIENNCDFVVTVPTQWACRNPEVPLVDGCGVDGYDFSQFKIIDEPGSVMQPYKLFTTYNKDPWQIVFNLCGPMKFAPNSSYYAPCDGKMACAFPTFGGIESAIAVADWPGAYWTHSKPDSFVMSFRDAQSPHCDPSFDVTFVCADADTSLTGATFHMHSDCGFHVTVPTRWACRHAHTSAGIIRGFGDRANKVRKYYGIPFAQPPVGANRWQNPIPVQQSDSIVDALAFKPMCLQDNDQANHTAIGSEDCLYLNVWAPLDQPAGTHLPVVVWIYGGSFLHGGTGYPDYDATKLVALHGNVIYVSIAYRLGVFGFMASPIVAAGANSPTIGNNGFADQRVALMWVQNNIQQFGGDPNRVTIHGESAGAISVCMHIMSPLSAGLFHAAISESGPCLNPIKRPEAERRAEVFTDLTGCTTASCLRALTAEQVLRFAVKSGGYPGFGPNSFEPFLDGYNLVDEPYKLLRQQQFNKVPFLLGSNHDEMALFVADVPAWKDVNAQTYDTLLAAQPKYIRDFYLQKFNNDYVKALVYLLSDQIFICGQRTMARYMSQFQPTYLYEWTHRPSAGRLSSIPWSGAFHYSEVPYVFGNIPSNSGLVGAPTPAEKNLISTMQHYWLRFAVSHSPNSMVDAGPANPMFWPSFTLEHQRNIELDEQLSINTDLYKERCDVWDAYFKFDSPAVAGSGTNTPPSSPSSNDDSSTKDTAIVALVFAMVALGVGLVMCTRANARSRIPEQTAGGNAYMELGADP